MTISELKPMPGKIIAKKLIDEMVTKGGIILTTAVNTRHDLVEVVAVGEDISENMNVKIEVAPGDVCLVLGKGIYDKVDCDEGLFFILNQSDIYAILEN